MCPKYMKPPPLTFVSKAVFPPKYTVLRLSEIWNSTKITCIICIVQLLSPFHWGTEQSGRVNKWWSFITNYLN